MRKLYLIRHGETLFNLRKKTQGWCDSPLTDRGIAQAKAAKQYFESQKISFDGIYTSTSERAIDTANLITNQAFTSIKGLKEWYFGTMEGEPEDLQKVPRKPGQLTHEDFFVQFGGESKEALQTRFKKTIHDILDKNHESTLCVTHAGAMWVHFLIRNHPDDLNGETFGNCCILEYNVLEDDLEFVKIINPVHHFPID